MNKLQDIMDHPLLAEQEPELESENLKKAAELSNQLDEIDHRPKIEVPLITPKKDLNPSTLTPITISEDQPSSESRQPYTERVPEPDLNLTKTSQSDLKPKKPRVPKQPKLK